MKETTGWEAKTIHRMLKIDPKAFGFKRNEENSLKCDLLVVVESLMVDICLMHSLRMTKRDGESNFYFVSAEDPDQAVEHILDMVKNRIPKSFGLDHIRDIKVLCPMNRGGVGALLLNIELQAAQNSVVENKAERFGSTFAPGDKVMQNQND